MRTLRARTGLARAAGRMGTSANLRYRNIRTMYTTDTRLTGFLGVKAVEVPNGSGGINEVLYFVNSAGTWKLAWVDYTTASLLQATDPGGGTPVMVGQGNIDPFKTAYGFATQRLAGARAAGNTFTHTADALVGFTMTTLGTGNSFFRVRQQDSTNTWILGYFATGAIQLLERVDGTDTNRGLSAAGVLATGHRCVTVMDNTTIVMYANGVAWVTYAGAANFKTATAGVLSSIGTGSAISDVVAWPRVVTGDALTALNFLPNP